MNEEEYLDLAATTLMLRACLAALIGNAAEGDVAFIHRVHSDAKTMLDNFVDRDARLWRISTDMLTNVAEAAINIAID